MAGLPTQFTRAWSNEAINRCTYNKAQDIDIPRARLSIILSSQSNYFYDFLLKGDGSKLIAVGLFSRMNLSVTPPVDMAPKYRSSMPVDFSFTQPLETVTQSQLLSFEHDSIPEKDGRQTPVTSPLFPSYEVLYTEVDLLVERLCSLTAEAFKRDGSTPGFNRRFFLDNGLHPVIIYSDSVRSFIDHVGAIYELYHTKLSTVPIHELPSMIHETLYESLVGTFRRSREWLLKHVYVVNTHTSQ